MKKTFKISLFFFLIFFSIANSNGQTIDELKIGCESKVGYFWHEATNSCQRQEDYSPITNCNSITEIKEKQKCYHDSILNLEAMKKKDIDDMAGLDQGSIGNLVQSASKWPLAAVHGTYFLTSVALWKFSGSTCMSVKLFALGGTVGLITDVSSWIYLNYKLENLKKDFKKAPTSQGVTQSSSAELQRHTFDLLSKGYATRAQVEMMRAIAYGVSSAIFAAATAVTTYEMINSSPCMNATKSTPDKSKTSGPTTSGSATTKATTSLTDKVTGTMSGISDKVSPLTQKIFSAPVRLALGVGITGVSTVLTYYTYKAYNLSKERKKYIDKLKEGLVETGGDAFCENRTDQSKPSCYCYNDDGSKNLKERSNSDICKTYWSSLVTPRKAPTDNLSYSETAAEDQPKGGCVALNNQFDPLCKCQEIKVKGAKGIENGCQKVALNIKSSGGNQSNLSDQLSQAAQSLMNGMANSLNSGTLSNMVRNAGVLNRIKDDGIKKINENRKKENLPPADFDPVKMMEKQINDTAPLLKDGVGRDLNELTGNVASKFGDVFPSHSSEKEDLPLNQSHLQYQSKSSHDFKKDKKKDEMMFPTLGGDDQYGGGRNMNNIPHNKNQENYQYDAGLEKDSDQDIFKIISKVYQEKGLERLFAD